MILWFPDLSPSGRQIVGQDLDTSGFKCCWMNEAAYIGAAGNGPGLKINNVRVNDWPEPIALSAGAVDGETIFCADYWPGGLRLSDGRRFEQGYHSTMAEDGYLVFLTGHDDRTQHVVDADGRVYDVGSIEYPSASRVGVAWTKYTGRHPHSKETWGAERGGQARRLHASGDAVEFSPVSVDTPHGQWIAAYRHDGVILYAAGSTDGYFFLSPDARAVDAKWDGATIRVVWNRPDGFLEERRQNLADPRRQLEEIRVISDPGIQPEPAPTPKPTPTPEPNMDILRDRTELVRRIRREVTGKADHEPLNDHNLDMLITRAVAWELRDEGWGIVRAKVGSANNVGGYTSDVIAQRDGEHVDVIASGGEMGGALWLPVRRNPEFQESWNAAIKPRWEAPTPMLPGTVVTPADDTHPYERDDLVRNECDKMLPSGQCDREREHPIHKVTAPGPVIPGPVPPGSVKDPRVAPIAAGLRAALAQLEAVPVVVCPPAPPCPLEHNPVCDRPHGDGTSTKPEHAELDRIVAGWVRAFAGGTRRIMHPDLTTFLLYRFLFEGVTDEQNIQEARERGQS